MSNLDGNLHKIGMQDFDKGFYIIFITIKDKTFKTIIIKD